MDDALTNEELAILKAAGWRIGGGGIYDGVVKVRGDRDSVTERKTRAEWRTEIEYEKHRQSVDAECARIREARAAEALRVTAGYTIEELKAMPDQALGRALRVANAVAALILGRGTVADVRQTGDAWIAALKEMRDG